MAEMQPIGSQTATGHPADPILAAQPGQFIAKGGKRTVRGFTEYPSLLKK
jgi:hypothetical protein